MQAWHSIFDMPMHGVQDVQPHGPESKDGEERDEFEDTHHQWGGYLADPDQTDQVSLADEQGG